MGSNGGVNCGFQSPTISNDASMFLHLIHLGNTFIETLIKNINKNIVNAGEIRDQQ